eukprot:3421678-Amphidinium_carterae.1
MLINFGNTDAAVLSQPRVGSRRSNRDKVDEWPNFLGARFGAHALPGRCIVRFEVALLLAAGTDGYVLTPDQTGKCELEVLHHLESANTVCRFTLSWCKTEKEKQTRLYVRMHIT